MRMGIRESQRNLSVPGASLILCGRLGTTVEWTVGCLGGMRQIGRMTVNVIRPISSG